MVLCMFSFEICTPEGRGGERGGSANIKTKHTEPLTQEIPSALYCTPEGRGGEKGGSANFQTKHTEPFTQEISRPLYKLPYQNRTENGPENHPHRLQLFFFADDIERGADGDGRANGVLGERPQGQVSWEQ